MIYDVLDNLEQYTGLFEHLDTALAFLAQNDLAALPEGLTRVDGDNVWLTVGDVTARPSEEAPFEVHEQHMQIHIDLAGTELFEVALGELEELAAPPAAAPDTQYYAAQLSGACVLGPGRFALAMTQEPFKPEVASASGPQLKKLVVWVRR